jgi:sterol desaturase/sphingolipid hydroxylase (fatty acid hydroxylase superfamily)
MHDWLLKFLNEFIDFFRIGGLVGIVKSHNYRAVLTFEGFLAVLSPMAPFLIMFEVAVLLLMRKFTKAKYRVSFLVILVNRVLERLVGLSVVVLCIGFFQKYAIFETTFTWYWFLYSYVIYELGSFTRHYYTHKVRLLWCFHSVHHASEDLNASITLNTFYIENLYTEFFTTTLCMLLGVQPLMLFFIMILDSIWGAFVHISEDSLRNGRLGFLEKIILTPSHHRVHHGRNPLYMDTNFSSIIPLWDRVFGTYQEERKDFKVDYGITRPINAQDFMDVYFGELKLLWKDLKEEPKWSNKIKYIFMPPGWTPDGPLHTAKTVRDEFIMSEKTKK